MIEMYTMRLQEEVNSVALKQAASLHQSAATEPAALTIGPSLRGKRSSLTSPSGLRQNSAGGVERFSGNSARTGVEEDSQFPGSDEQQIKTLAEKFDVSAEIVRTILDVGTESRKTKIFADESIAKAPAVVTAAMQQTSSGQASSDNAHSVLRQPGLSAAKAITAVGQKRPSASVSLAKSVASVAPVSALPGPRVLAVAIPSSGGRSVLSSGAPKGRIAVRPAASHSNTIAALVSPTRSGTGPMLSQPTITVVNRGSSATNAKPVISILQPIATGLDKSATVQRVGLVSSSRGSNTDESSKHAVASNQMSQLVTTHTSTGVHETVVSTRSEALPVSPSGKTAPTATSECKEISTCEANEKVQVPPPKPELDSGGVNARNSGGAGDGVTREADGADTDDPGQCCDDQDCGVTVMPGEPRGKQSDEILLRSFSFGQRSLETNGLKHCLTSFRLAICRDPRETSGMLQRSSSQETQTPHGNETLGILQVGTATLRAETSGQKDAEQRRGRRHVGNEHDLY